MHDPSLSHSRRRFWLLPGDLETLPPPDSLDHRQADVPAGAEHAMDAAIPVAAVLLGQLDHVRGQTALVAIILRSLALGRAVLADHRTGAPLGRAENLAHLLNANTAAGGT